MYYYINIKYQPYLYTNINYDALSDEYLIEKYELRADP